MEPFKTAFPKLISWGVPDKLAIWFVCIAIVAFSITLIIHFAVRINLFKSLIKFYLLEYVVYVLCATLLLRVPAEYRIVDIDLFSKYNYAFVLLDPESLLEVIMNTLMFVPLGFLMGFNGVKSHKAIGFGFGLSFLIEATQYIFALGYCELSDVIHNTLGCVLGLLLYTVIDKIFFTRRIE